MATRPKPITGTFYPDAYTFGWGDILGPSATLEDLMAQLEAGEGGGGGRRGRDARREGSRTSTESLTSILYHDSFDEDELSTDSEQPAGAVSDGGTDDRRPTAATAAATARKCCRPRLKPALPDEATRPQEVARRLNNGGNDGDGDGEGETGRQIGAGAAIKRKVARRRQLSSPPNSNRSGGTAASSGVSSTSAKRQPPQQRRRRIASAASTADTEDRRSDASAASVTPSSAVSASASASAGGHPVRGQTWEAWFLAKERRLREQRRREAEELQERSAREAAAEAAKKEKETSGQATIRQWLDNKRKQQKLQRDEQQRQKDEAEAAKMAEKSAIKEKSDVEIAKWNRAHDAKLRAAKQKVQQDEAAAEARKQELKKKSDEAVDKWMKAHKDARPHPPYSYGYTDGRLMSYYDKNSNPPPSFVNAEPWLPPTETVRRERPPAVKD